MGNCYSTSDFTRSNALEAHEVQSHGEPTFRVKKKTFAMYANADNHHGRGRDAVWIKSAPGRQARAVKGD
jgi:hypothetical protein